MKSDEERLSVSDNLVSDGQTLSLLGLLVGVNSCNFFFRGIKDVRMYMTNVFNV